MNTDSIESIRRNLAWGDRLLASGAGPSVIATVSGSTTSTAFWQRELGHAQAAFGARVVRSLHEDLPVNQAFGLLLLWHRLRDEIAAGEGALCACVFGEGTRATPFTEAECGQKPAIRSFVAEGHGPDRRYLSTVELAMRTFAPVEAYLRRSGFNGIVVKWGDEVQIPTLDLSGQDPSLAQADVVRFVSMRKMTADDAANKDWVGVDAQGRVTAFIARRPLHAMERLADQGLLLRRGGALIGGVNLGSIALSRPLLDALYHEFHADVHDASADRRSRPDLDPQLFTALVVAAEPDPETRNRAWAQALGSSPAIRHLQRNLPDVLLRLRRALDRFKHHTGRPVSLRAVDFGTPYWGDIGQHRQMYAWYSSLRRDTPQGAVARLLAGLPEVADADGNRLGGSNHLGPHVRVRNSVLIDVSIDSGDIVDSVLIGTRAGHVRAVEAFDVLSAAPHLDLAARAGTYRVVTNRAERVEEGHRRTVVFFPEGPVRLDVHEATDLRDRPATYEVPVLDNAMSFQEAHQRILKADPEAVASRRSHAVGTTAQNLGS